MSVIQNNYGNIDTKWLLYSSCFQHTVSVNDFKWKMQFVFNFSVGELNPLCSSSARGARTALLPAVGSVECV